MRDGEKLGDEKLGDFVLNVASFPKPMYACFTGKGTSPNHTDLQEHIMQTAREYKSDKAVSYTFAVIAVVSTVIILAMVGYGLAIVTVGFSFFTVIAISVIAIAVAVKAYKSI